MPVAVVVEVERVDVLVLLGRILRVRDRAVGQDGEPVGMLFGPRVIGCALQREVDRDLQAELRGRGDEARGSRSRVPNSGWIASCPPSAEPIAQGEPTSSGPGVSVLLRPLRLTSPIGWIGGR